MTCSGLNFARIKTTRRNTIAESYVNRKTVDLNNRGNRQQVSGHTSAIQYELFYVIS